MKRFKKNTILISIISLSMISHAKYTAYIGAEIGYTVSEIVVVGISYGEWSSYNPFGDVHSCETFNPVASALSSYPVLTYVKNTGSMYTFTQDCSQDYTRSRDVYDEMSNGTQVFVSTEEDTMTDEILQSVIKDATSEQIYINNNTYIQTTDVGLSVSSYRTSAYIAGIRVAKEYGDSSYSGSISAVQALGYKRGNRMIGDEYAIILTNVTATPVWQYSGSTGVTDCTGLTVADYTDYSGNSCSTQGATMYVCSDLDSVGNNPNWQKVTLTCSL